MKALIIIGLMGAIFNCLSIAMWSGYGGSAMYGILSMLVLILFPISYLIKENTYIVVIRAFLLGSSSYFLYTYFEMNNIINLILLSPLIIFLIVMTIGVFKSVRTRP